MPEYDVTLTEDDERPGKLLAHRPDCPMVSRHRDEDRPLMTMFGCEGPLPFDVRQHECLVMPP